MKKLSIVVPVYNEEESIPLFIESVTPVLQELPYYSEILFVNDGSNDESGTVIQKLTSQHQKITYRYIEFSRNFGKETATAAGLNHASGDAIIMIDADLQHPPYLIRSFVQEWERGYEIVVGVRNRSPNEHWVKKTGARTFYRLMHQISDTEMISGETDFRLMDRMVVDEFNRMTEHTRITRGLINWLGFKRSFIYFNVDERKRGVSSFNIVSLIRLAMNSFISHSLLPLRLAGYLGVAISLFSFVLGIVMLTDRYIHPLGYAFSGPAMLADLIVFLVGVVLIAIGILAIYIGSIHQEVRNRPLYVIRKKIDL